MTRPLRYLLLLLALLPAIPAQAAEELLARARTDFQVTDLDGKSHRLADYRGKWLVVNYWASWCPPCVEELPELVSFHDAHHGKDAEVLGINFEETTAERLKPFLEQWMIDYPVVLGLELPEPPFGGAEGLPTTYIISPEGKLVGRRVGGITSEWLEALIQRAAAPRPEKT